MPKNLVKFFPKIEGIDIFNSSLELLEASDLAPFKYLKELILIQNKLVVLEEYLFIRNVHLRAINFEQNSLRFIGGNILEPLVNLSDALFLNNICISSNAQRQSSIPELIKNIKQNCSSLQTLIDIKLKDIETSPNSVSVIDEKTVGNFCVFFYFV